MQQPIRQARPLTERPLVPEQRLAAAVLAQAVVDAKNVHQSERCRAGATAFLLEQGAMFQFWTGVAGLDTEMVRYQAQLVLTRSPAVPTSLSGHDDALSFAKIRIVSD